MVRMHCVYLYRGQVIRLQEKRKIMEMFIFLGVVFVFVLLSGYLDRYFD